MIIGPRAKPEKTVYIPPIWHRRTPLQLTLRVTLAWRKRVKCYSIVKYLRL